MARLLNRTSKQVAEAALLVAGICACACACADHGSGGVISGSGGLGGSGNPASGAPHIGGSVGHGGPAGGANIGGSSGRASEGGAPNGVAGESAGGGANSSGITVGIGDLLSITYTPATPDTVIKATLDPACDVFGADIEAQGAICANIELKGQLSAATRLCFASSAPRAIFNCRAAAPECVFPGTVHYASGHRYCCSELGLDLQQSVPGQQCVTTSANFTGSLAYATGVDSDADRLPNLDDNCPSVANAIQFDQDHDAIGESCDNCPTTPNQDQTDSNHDGIGDACESGGGAEAGASGSGGSGGFGG